jgi:hypothetical protein
LRRVRHLGSARRASLAPSGPVMRNQSAPGNGSLSRAKAKKGQQRRSSTIQRATESSVPSSFGRRSAQPSANSPRSSACDSGRRPRHVRGERVSRCKADGSHATGSRYMIAISCAGIAREPRERIGPAKAEPRGAGLRRGACYRRDVRLLWLFSILGLACSKATSPVPATGSVSPDAAADIRAGHPCVPSADKGIHCR